MSVNLGSELKKYEKFASWKKCTKVVNGSEILFVYDTNYIKFVLDGTHVMSMENIKGSPPNSDPTEDEIIEYFMNNCMQDDESDVADVDDDFEEAESVAVDSIKLSCGSTYLWSEIAPGSDLYKKVMDEIAQQVK